MQGHERKHRCQSGGRKGQGAAEATAFIGISWGKTRHDRVNSFALAGLSYSGGLWGIGAVTIL